MKYLFYILFFLILFSCTSSSKRWDTSPIASNENLYVVNIDDAPKEDFINFSSFFHNVETIILETSEDFLIGEVNSITVLNDYIVVMDSKITESVLVFDKEGGFMHKIGKIGQGPGEYVGITDSSIDYQRKEIYLLDSYSDKLLKYDIVTGKFINSILLNGDDFDNYYMQYISSNVYTSSIPFSETDDSFLLQEFDVNTGNPIASYLKASLYNKGWNSSLIRADGFFYPREDGSARYTQYFMDTVVSIRDNEIMPYMAIKSKNWITEKDVQELIEYKKKNDGTLSLEILFERDISYNIHHYFEFENIIHFQYYNKGITEVVIYDKELKTTQRANYIKDDLVYSGDWVVFPTFAFTDNEGVYSFIRSEQIPLFLEIANTGGLNTDLDKRELLERLPEDSNPVIFYYKRN